MSRGDDELTLTEAAELLGVHYMTVYRYVRLGYVPARKVGREWRLRREDLSEVTAAPRRQGGRRTRWDVRLARRVLDGDQAGAWQVVEAALTSGMAIAAAYERLVIPAMRKVGDLWKAGEITVAKEHAASQVMTRIVSQLGARAPRRGIHKGMLVLGTTSTELHALPLAIAADLLRTEGFGVLDLGPNLPADSFAALASNQERLVAVGVSATTPDQDQALEETIDTLRASVDVPIVFGGSGIRSGQHATDLGADAWGRTVRDAVPILTEMVG